MNLELIAVFASSLSGAGFAFALNYLKDKEDKKEGVYCFIENYVW